MKRLIPALLPIFAVLFLAVVCPLISPYSYDEQNNALRNLPPRIPFLERFGIMDGSAVLTKRRADGLEDPGIYPPNSIIKIMREYETLSVPMADIKADIYALNGVKDRYFWFGTDYLGRDMWTRLWTGARISLFIALAAVMINILMGSVCGAVSGFYGGFWDLSLMRAAEIVEGIPQLAVFTLIILFMGAGTGSIILALSVRGWTGYARVVRAQFLRYRESEFVLAARIMGAGDRRLIFRHILPYAAGPVITKAMSAVPGAIFAESFLAYLGLGIQAPLPSIGVLLADGRETLLQSPYQTFIPALVMCVLMVSFNGLAIRLRLRSRVKSEQ
ncbi:MAG: ABC transporter permease [Clostridiales bacterium]|nr:ABC transporter permease [Clostridiales bacterium]